MSTTADTPETPDADSADSAGADAADVVGSEDRPAVDIPYRFEPTTTSAEIRERYDGIDDGFETGEKVTIAGRLMLRRVQGKLAFGTLQDGGGRIQLVRPRQGHPRLRSLLLAVARRLDRGERRGHEDPQG